MADDEDVFVPRTGKEFLAEAWWEALDELRLIIATNEETNHRLKAAEIILTYTTSLNVGIGEPFLPEEPNPVDEDDEEER